MRAYSLDLRERVIAALKEGQTEKQVAKRFGVSESTVSRYDRRDRNQQPLAAKRVPGRAPLLPSEQEAHFRALVGTRTDWRLETLRHAWQERGGVLMSKSALHEHLMRLKITYKKKASRQKSVPRQSGPPLSSR